MYELSILNEKYHKIFQGVYNDFRLRARTDYKFEIDPLLYEDFLDSIEKGLINCIILLEDSIPTGFLAFTTIPDGIIEIFVIHCIGHEDITNKRSALLDNFLDLTKSDRKHRAVSYAMLGIQEDLKQIVAQKGFKFVDTSVVDFNLNNKQLVKETLKTTFSNLPIGYKLTPYRDIYFEELSQAIFSSFSKSQDINFDPRFGSLEGCKDIADKITTSVYGRFLPQASKILLYENQIVGFCLANITGDKIGNLPLIGIIEKHRGQNLSEAMVKATIADIIKLQQSNIVELNELNASLDLSLANAVNMYKAVGFIQSYSYAQAYLPRG